MPERSGRSRRSSLSGRIAGIWGEQGAEAKADLASIRDLAKETLKTLSDPPGALDQRAAHLLPLWIVLVERVRAAYRAAKSERGALDFDDLERLTRDLLEDELVRVRYRAEFKQVLVDEFQDTNAAQWGIIQRIADPDQPGCLFVVGDPKQSIYGFRGADVSVFEQVQGVIMRRGVSVNLDTSFRSHKALIGCLNHLFAAILTRDPDSPVREYQIEFGGMQADRADLPDDAPVLELMLLDKAQVKEAEEEQAGRNWEARAVARRIKQLVGNRLIYDKDDKIIRRMEYGDVALLFQAMTQVTIYEAALKAEGIPYVTTAGKGYYDRQEVWDLLNLLRALYNPADHLALAAALRSPLFSLSDDALLALRLITDADSAPIPLWAALDQPECVPADERDAVAFARDTLRDLRRRAGRVTIAELLRLALDQTGYLAVLTGLPDGSRLRGNVEKLIEKADSAGRITLSGFTQYLQDMSEIEVREGEAPLESEGAVRLMTVHKSKGLEFPLVVLVDASYQHGARGGGLVNGLACKVYDPDQNQMASPYAMRRAEQLDQLREEAERRRLLYVAATRAQDYLIISGQVDVKDTLQSKGWLKWVIEALGVGEIAPEPQTIPYDWGDVLIDFPAYIPDDDRDGAPVVDFDAADDAEMPSLIQPIRMAAAPARTLSASQIADLGSARHADAVSRDFYAERWRRSVLQDAPSRIDPARWTPNRRVGNIVHRALRWSLPDDPDALADRLRRYAWEENIIDEAENRRAVSELFRLIQQILKSDLFDQIARAQEVYRELPFVYRAGEREVNGVIDLLMRGGDGAWRLVDYKTGWLGLPMSSERLRRDARRYHLQMGIYAAAVRELVKITPFVHIHYIRYAQTITISENEWQGALAQLDDAISDLLD